MFITKLFGAKNSIDVKADMDELDVTAPETKATYWEITDYILEKHGINVFSLDIALVREKYRFIKRDCHNKLENPDSKQSQCSLKK